MASKKAKEIEQLLLNAGIELADGDAPLFRVADGGVLSFSVADSGEIYLNATKVPLGRAALMIQVCLGGWDVLLRDDIRAAFMEILNTKVPE